MPSLISPDRKLLFVHVPRTGGNSIAAALAELFEPPDPLKPHKRADEFDVAEDCFSFSIVRNPWDMCVSWMAWHRDQGDKRTMEQAVRKVERPVGDYRIDRCDLVLRFENLQEEFNRLCDLLEIERRTLPLLSRSWHEPYQSYYRNRNLIDTVARRFAREIRIFNYEF